MSIIEAVGGERASFGRGTSETSQRILVRVCSQPSTLRKCPGRSVWKIHRFRAEAGFQHKVVLSQTDLTRIRLDPIYIPGAFEKHFDMFRKLIKSS